MLHDFVGSSPPQTLRVRDYDMRVCERCSLVFAAPMEAGDARFYNWITSAPDYYPRSRWEWNVVMNLLASRSPNETPCLLVDVGCGSGLFLQRARQMTGWRSIGIDISEESVKTCRAKALEAFCCDARSILEIAPEGATAFTLWHVVEHVEDPVFLLQSIAGALKSQGSIFFSVPLSPTSSEALALDPLNLPPHHLTRWSFPSLHALADRLAMDVEFHTPAGTDLFSSLFNALRLKFVSPFYGNNRLQRWTKVIRGALSNPAAVAKARRVLAHRMDSNGKSLPDEILVRLSSKVIGASREQADFASE